MNNSDLLNGEDDDVVEVSGDPSSDARKKLDQLRNHLPFIAEVRKIYERHLSRDQFRKLEMLSQLLQRKRVSLQTLTKIERVVQRLQVQFNGIRNRYAKNMRNTGNEREHVIFPFVLNPGSDVIEIADDVEAADINRPNSRGPDNRGEKPGREAQKNCPPAERLWNRIRNKNDPKTSEKEVKNPEPVDSTVSSGGKPNDKEKDVPSMTNKSDKPANTSGTKPESSPIMEGTPTLEEARKKLAALRCFVSAERTTSPSVTEMVPSTSPSVPSSSPLLQATPIAAVPVMASNSNDPRGRKTNYTNLDTSVHNNNNNQMDSLNPRQALPIVSLLDDTPKQPPRSFQEQPTSPIHCAPSQFIKASVQPVYRRETANFLSRSNNPDRRLRPQANINNIIINTSMPMAPARGPTDSLGGASNNVQRFNRPPADFQPCAPIAAGDRPFTNVSQRYSAGAANNNSMINDLPTNNDPRRYSATVMGDALGDVRRNQFNGPNNQTHFNGPKNQINFNGPHNPSNFNAQQQRYPVDPRRQHANENGNGNGYGNGNANNMPPFNELNMRDDFDNCKGAPPPPPLKNWQQNDKNFNQNNGGGGSNWAPNKNTSFNGPFRGSYRGRGRGRGGSVNPQPSRYHMTPVTSSLPTQSSQNRPRTYREHREAKARAEAEAEAAAAKAAEKKNLQPAPKQSEAETANVKSAAPDTEKLQVESFQLDTSYRTVTLDAPPKKISFKIPKKVDSSKTAVASDKDSDAEASPADAAASKSSQFSEAKDKEGKKPKEKEKEKENKTGEEKAKVAGRKNRIKHGKEKEGETPGKQTNIIPSPLKQAKELVKPEKCQKTVEETIEVQKTVTTNKNKSFTKSGSQEKSLEKKQEHKNSGENLSEEVCAKQTVSTASPLPKTVNPQLDKVKNVSTETNELDASVQVVPPACAADAAEVTAKPSFKRKRRKKNKALSTEKQPICNETVECEENQPVVVDVPPPAEASSTEVAAKLTRKRKTLSTEEPPAKELEIPNEEAKPQANEPADKRLSDVAIEASATLPKISKLKIVLGPNARTELIPSNKSTSTNTATVRRTLPFMDDVKSLIEEKSIAMAPEQPKLRRIMSRRASMASIASKPMIDKNELIPSKSLLYEDLHEQIRKKERVSKSLAHMFEKTSDNCTVSTQNIITGKRRTRMQEPTLNEIHLYRTAFKMGGQFEQKAEQKVLPNFESTLSSTDLVKRKRGRPHKDKLQLPTEVGTPELPAAKRQRLSSEENATDVAAVKTDAAPVAVVATKPTKRRTKRNELDKLNEDIAAMYCADDVMRASGRRACTQIQAPPVLAASEDTSTSLNSADNNDAKYDDTPFLRNMARRGRPFRSSITSAMNRAAFKAKQLKIKKCRVRIKRCSQLAAALVPSENKKPTKTTVKKRKSTSEAVERLAPVVPVTKNNRNDWHALSSAIVICVVCNKPLKRYLSHYLQNHAEFYAARLPPGVLAELRASRLNRPVFAQHNVTLRNYHTCPFCIKTLFISSNSWIDHLGRHTGEINYQCSKCLLAQHRQNTMAKHVIGCGKGAKILSNNYYTLHLPLVAHVCHLCELVQISKANMQRHYVRHHDALDDKLPKESYTIVLFDREGVPKIKSESEANALRKKYHLNFPEALKNATSPVKDEVVDEAAAAATAGMPPPPDTDEMVPVITEPVNDTETETDQLPSDIDGDSLIVVNECKLETLEDDILSEDCVPLSMLEKELSIVGETKPSKPPRSWDKQFDAVLAADNLSGIGSDDSNDFLSDCEIDMLQKAKETAVSAKDTKKAAPKRDETSIATATATAVDSNALCDEWVDLEIANGTMPTKTIFQKFNKFYTKFNSKSASGRKQGKSKETTSTCSDSDGICAELETPAAPAPPEPKPLPEESPALARAALPPCTTVQNVAYRERPALEQKIAYYCMYAGCNFLFSNEQEGLENHFAREHPIARWSGRCEACSKQVLPTGDYLIKLELGHMVSMHMSSPATSDVEEAVPMIETTSPAPAVAKLRVRRFTGDRLMAEDQTSESQPQPQAQSSEMEHTNTMLRNLLSSQPRPITQQTDLNAAGLGEFLCAKPTESSQQQQQQRATPEVINHSTGLGLAIGNVFSLTEHPTLADGLGLRKASQNESIAAKTVTLPPTTSGDFVLTQSFSQQQDPNGHGQMPVAQLNISIVPAASGSQQQLAATPRGGKTQTRMDFRCMVPRCGFCTATAAHMRQHLTMHSQHLSSEKYLRCGYCLHVAQHVDEYINHGISAHQLEKQQSEQHAPHVDVITDQIRSVLSQRQGDKPPPAASDSYTHPTVFRCMAPNCVFRTRTIFHIRQHLNFHRLGFSHNEYLRCAYCPHTAHEVHSYITHAITEHNLASQAEMDEYQQSLLMSDGSTAGATPQLTTASARRNKRASPINDVLRALLSPTGLVSNKLYACPQKGCNTSLSEDTFLNHVMFHLSSSGGSSITCKHCSLACDRPSQLRVHLQRQHARHRFICGICLATTVNQRLMLHHVRTQHGEEYQLVNRQLRYMLLNNSSAGNNASSSGINRANKDDDKCYLCIVEHPFGQRQLNEFLNALVDEQQQRSDGTKRIYRSSEVRSLPRQPWYTSDIYCGDCVYSTAQRVRMRCHLESHLNAAMKAAYGDASDNLDMDALDNDELQPEDIFDMAALTMPPTLASASKAATTAATATALVATATATAAAAGQQQTTTPAAAAAAAAVVAAATATTATTAAAAAATATTATAAAVVPATPLPGKHRVLVPKYAYVPEDMRYYCGIGECNVVLPTERDFRDHLIKEHTYDNIYACTHCSKVLRGSLNVENVLQHLRYHQEFLYQCGACEHFHYKRINIERHINDKHLCQDVDLIIHKRKRTYAKLNLTRWIKPPKPSTSQDDYMCNMCYHTEPSFSKMLLHIPVHGERCQYRCPHCHFEAHNAVNLVSHMLQTHPNERVQPKQVFKRLRVKGRLTLCFYCNLCGNIASIFQHMTMHGLEKHNCRHQYKCPHCSFSHFKERTVMAHMLQEHAALKGLAVHQFDRVMNEMLDIDSWQLGHNIEQPAEAQMCVANANTAAATSSATASASAAVATTHCPNLIDEIEIISSDSEDESHQSDCSDDTDNNKQNEFICSHCHDSFSDLDEMRNDHWKQAHGQLPFYFGVQPQLRCPQCQNFTGNANKLLDHLLAVHHIRNLVASDIRQPDECAFCEHRYKDWAELAQHIMAYGHMSNDLKHFSEEDLNGILKLGGPGPINEYYQCTVCSIVMPTQVAMAHHGSVQHKSAADPFCFRRLSDQVVYHCSFCMFAASNELVTLRHMLQHYRKFRHCNFCKRQQEGGFDEYIQHCYDFHRMDVHKFREVHTYAELKIFLMQMLYQFKNGLVISKRSLRHTQYSDESSMRQLYKELMNMALRPPIPRITLTHLMNRNSNSGGTSNTTTISSGNIRNSNLPSISSANMGSSHSTTSSNNIRIIRSASQTNSRSSRNSNDSNNNSNAKKRSSSGNSHKILRRRKTLNPNDMQQDRPSDTHYRLVRGEKAVAQAHYQRRVNWTRDCNVNAAHENSNPTAKAATADEPNTIVGMVKQEIASPTKPTDASRIRKRRKTFITIEELRAMQEHRPT